MDGTVEVQVSYSNVANFSMVCNRVPLIKRMEVRNTSAENLGNIKLHVSFRVEDDEAGLYNADWEVSIGSIPSGQYVNFDRIPLKLSKEQFFLADKECHAFLTIKVLSLANDESLAEETLDVTILPRDTWIGSQAMPELLAFFVTPGRKSVSLITEEASAYQSGLPEKAKEYVNEIYNNIRRKGPFTITQYPPKASTISAMDVLSRKQGTSLDFALFYASCLERAGLNPVLVLTDSRVITACWLEDRTFAECVEDDITLITKRMAAGVDEVIAVDTAVLAEGGSFEEAQESAAYYIGESSFDVFIDVTRCRGSRIYPMPERLGDEMSYVPRKRPASQQLEPPPASYTKQRIWENKLLDLSLRNGLISYRLRRNSIQLMSADLQDLAEAIAEIEEFQVMPMASDIEVKRDDNICFPVNLEAVTALTGMEHSNRRLRTYVKDDELRKQIAYIYRTTKANMEENGANTLYLALGFLKWYESDVSEKERRAPIVLIPVELVKKSAGKGYVLRARDEDPLVNVTLVEMLRQNFNINVPDVDPLPLTEKGIDIMRVFATFRRSVIDKPRWEVEDIAVLGQFSFNQFIMWNDMRNRSQELTNHKVVSSLISGKMEWEQTNAFQSPDTLDNTILPSEIAVPISADSSQLSAICASGRGLSFVLHGPPGTGKSQTITNIIANALFQGKTVLFIAEKMAALSVVQRRLDMIGLGPFSLELHSNKTKKRDALLQLDEVLNIVKASSPAEYATKAEKLFTLRKDLNTVISAIHVKRDIGLSLYDLIAIYESTPSKKNIPITREQITSAGADKYDLWINVLRDVATAGAACGDVSKHPLKGIGACDYSYAFRDEILKLLKSYQDALQNITSPTGVKLESYNDYQIVYLTLKKLQEGEYTQAMLLSCDDPSIKVNLELVTEVWKRRRVIRDKLLRVFDGGVFSIDARKELDKWNEQERKLIKLGQKDIIKTLKMFSSTLITRVEAPHYLQALCDYSLAGEKMWETGENFSELFGNLWNVERVDPKLLYEIYQQAKSLKASAASLGDETWHQIINLDDDSAQSYIDAFERFSKLTLDVTLKLSLDIEELAGAAKLSDFSEKISRWIGNIDSLRSWSVFAAKVKEAESLGIANVAEMYLAGELESDEILPAFSKSLAKAYCEYIIDSEQALSSFNGKIFEDKILKYREATDEFEKLTREELVARLSANLPDVSGSAAVSSELGILRKAIRTGGRGMSIRNLFDQIPNLLKTICPCMLMSPISVAQYVDPAFPKFDLVIFDEASQMQTCYAVGAIARGKECIVVGDPKQLPPTSFFTINTIDEDNLEKEDLESILDDCLAISMPQEHLLWHYRSRHESLIAFSNMEFYDNKLFTFPSPNDIVSKVSMVHVKKGYYDRGKTKQNKAEAEAVIKEILRRLADPVLRNQSIGVVAFSMAQQNLIEDLLADALDKNPELDAIDTSSEEPIFVKNLENVQGDERDVILFSIGYGPDKSGAVRLNFGPLNREGGWRRLNVAVSRARREMIVFTTLLPDQIDLAKTNSEGVSSLKAFLEFAKNGKNCLPRGRREAAGEGIENIIAHRIEEMGYKTNVDIGSSGYRMDIGVVNPENNDEYVLGIMIDGKNQQAPSTARDRNIVQESVLTSLGWNIHHLWVMDWWYNSKKELSKIKESIDASIKKTKELEVARELDENNLRANTQVVINVDIPENEEETHQEENITVSIKQTVEGLPIVGNPTTFFLDENRSVIENQIKDVLRSSAPISAKQLQKMIYSSWSISRPVQKTSKYYDEIIKSLNLKQTNFNGRTFIWADDQNPETYGGYRQFLGSERRDILDIPSEEIVNAIKEVVKNQFALSQADLIKEVGKIFGFNRQGNTIKAVIGDCIEMCIKSGYVKADGDRISIA